MHPAVLFSLIWFFILLLHLIFKLSILNLLFDLHLQTLVIIFFGTLSFSIGSFLITLLKEKRERKKFGDIYNNPNWLNYFSSKLQVIILLITCLGLPYYIYQSYKIFLLSNIDNFFIGLRTELSYGDVDLGPEKYLTTVSYISMAFQQYCFYKKKSINNYFFLIISISTALIYAVFTTGRGPILWVATILIGMNFLHGKNFSFKRIIITISLFIVFFSIIGIFFGKGGNTEASFQDNLKSSSEVTSSYLVASVNALDLKLQQNIPPNYNGNNSLRFFKALGQSAGFFKYEKVPELIQEFSFVPYSTNVYTIYYAYISDYGVPYALAMLAIFGMIQTLIYNKAIQTKNLRYSIYYSLTLYPLFMSFFQDIYISLLSTWLQVIVITELLILCNRIIFEKND